MAKRTQIDILRHGLPEGDNCLRGHTDFVLTEQGFEQMKMAIENLNELDCVVSSSLQRCSSFADFIAQKFTINALHSDSWREMNFGDWDGLTRQQLVEQLGDDIDHLKNRRVRSVGELLQNLFRIGFQRLLRKLRSQTNKIGSSQLSTFNMCMS